MRVKSLLFAVEYLLVGSDYTQEFLEWLVSSFGLEDKRQHFSLSRGDLDRGYALLGEEQKKLFKKDYERFRELLGEDEETEFYFG